MTSRETDIQIDTKENENLSFRTFLKCHADEETLDRQFLKLHKELFAGYDCSRCRNCCKMYSGTIPEDDLNRDVEYLGMSLEQFLDTYFEEEPLGGKYTTKHMPCDFLEPDGACRLGDLKPDSCKKYPYTDQPERLSSFYSVLPAVEVCPIAYEIFERLKRNMAFGAESGNFPAGEAVHASA